ncbi:L-serine ammonia-lyase, iron-sulfur-dependent subunit beta [Alicyclobacillus cycloheptanicus]|uniref:L-serine deaminase n=1 Tax=Alicyclobacillus cycloheptanicus TaxID=1457 RepID=A0ABT9XFX1_9BACL|nr:L-serine ammonia-lyase, iron-sulfur-dependent subunit beta [Alicyclobacillus cycloheptanicus]MDQ0189189.1 L-serine dehydratase [Alicyclobacillus cycloheptanicus]WDM00375.1 L-serine ammonia-lyase, iron-sulfur-dependent subunit beta [Alicyclobacillus cycloheptanicus]
MKYTSVFEIIGPVMVGPSSSHTAGAVRIGNLARQLLGEPPVRAQFWLMGSFAETYRGHGTDVALLAGVLGLPTDDPGVPRAVELAAEAGLTYTFEVANLGFYHPNTVKIVIGGGTRQVELIASSLGGGKAEVQELDGLSVRFTGERPTLVLFHHDRKGFLAKVLAMLNEAGYNVSRLNLERWRLGGRAITVVEVDEPIDEALPAALTSAIPELHDVIRVHV